MVPEIIGYIAGLYIGHRVAKKFKVNNTEEPSEVPVEIPDDGMTEYELSYK